MINHIDPLNQFTWWSSLKHGGLLIAPARLANYFSTQQPELSSYWAGRLRGAVQAQQNAEKPGAQGALLDTVLEGVLRLPAQEWKKASSVDSKWGHRLITGENFKPRRLWLETNGAALPVFDDDVKQIGIGSGRRSIARVVEWLRKSEQKLALLTNGMQWRLIHAGPDYEAWCEWDIALWFEEGEPSDQVRALLHLLSPKALTPPKEGEPAPLVAAIQDTRKPLWDSGVRDVLHQAAVAEGCDFPGLGPHSFRRANITWRQQVGGSAIEASKIAGHSDLEMTGEYTFVAPERQNELTRRIQQKLARANKKELQSVAPVPPQSSTPEISPTLIDAESVTTVVQ